MCANHVVQTFAELLAPRRPIAGQGGPGCVGGGGSSRHWCLCEVWGAHVSGWDDIFRIDGVEMVWHFVVEQHLWYAALTHCCSTVGEPCFAALWH